MNIAIRRHRRHGQSIRRRALDAGHNHPFSFRRRHCRRGESIHPHRPHRQHSHTPALAGVDVVVSAIGGENAPATRASRLVQAAQAQQITQSLL